jgi:hypothetical protein
MGRFVFFKVKTHRVLSWQAKIIIIAVIPLVLWLLWPFICKCITGYLYQVDKLQPASRIIVENWDGSIELFDGSLKIASEVGAKEIVSIIFEDTFTDLRKRHAYYLNAWATGIDTTHFSFIIVPKREPRTLNIARAVIDTAYKRHWMEVTVVTFDLHSSRSGKAYRLAAKQYNITVRIAGIPLEGVTANNWTTSSSGLSNAFSELIKKLYYDFYVF